MCGKKEIKTFDFIEQECSLKSGNQEMSRREIASESCLKTRFFFFCPSGLKEALFYFRCLCDRL